MLKFFRQKHIAKVIFWGLVILILPAFVLWGSGSLSGSKEKRPAFVGTIDNKRVSFDDFMESIVNVRMLITLNNLDKQEEAKNFLKQTALVASTAWQRLMVLEQAKRYKIKVSDDELVRFIRTAPIFVRSGGFDERLYQQVLRYRLGVEPRTFEEFMRQNLVIESLREAVAKDVKMSDEEIRNEYRKINEKFKLSYVAIDGKGFLEKTKADEAAVLEYYDKHKNEFMMPQKEKGPEETGQGARLAPFEEVKDKVKAIIAEKEANELAFTDAGDTYKKISELMEKDKLSFENAASELKLKTAETPLFQATDYLEGIGEASSLVDAIVGSGEEKAVGPIRTRKGALIFKLKESQKIDEEKFKKEKEEFANKALDAKKSQAFNGWITSLYPRTRMNLRLEEVEKYIQ